MHYQSFIQMFKKLSEEGKFSTLDEGEGISHRTVFIERRCLLLFHLHCWPLKSLIQCFPGYGRRNERNLISETPSLDGTTLLWAHRGLTVQVQPSLTPEDGFRYTHSLEVGVSLEVQYFWAYCRINVGISRTGLGQTIRRGFKDCISLAFYDLLTTKSGDSKPH